MNRTLRWIAIPTASLLMLVGVSLGAGAQTDPTTPAPSTQAPDLLNATAEGERVVYCFDQSLDLDDLGAPGLFEVRGYNNQARSEANDVEVDEDDSSCASASFENGDRPLEEFTIAVAEAGAAENEAGQQSVGRTVTLGGSELNFSLGDTTAPSLVRFERIDGAVGRFTFNRMIDCDILSTADNDHLNFKFYDSDGVLHSGTSIEDCDDDEVDVAFGVDPGNGERYVVNNTNGTDDASTDENGNPRGDVCSEEDSTGFRDCQRLSQIGDGEDDPDLTDVDRAGDESWLYAFDEEVDDTTITSGLFYVFTEDATLYSGSNCVTVGGANTQVRCDFPALEEAADAEFPLAAVDHAAFDADDDGQPNTAGTFPMNTAMSWRGFTDAPDLTRCDLSQPGGGLVIFRLDEPIATGSVNETDFFVVDESGDESDANDVVDHTGNEVQVEFDPALTDGAAGCGIFDFSFDDWLGNGNPLWSMAFAGASPTSARSIQLCHGDVAGTTCATGERSNRPGDEHEMTARVTDANGNPVANVPVQFRETGPGIFTPQGGSTATVLTDANGLAAVLLTSDVEGTSTIVAEIQAGSGPNGSRGAGASDDECEQPAGANNSPPAGNCISQTLGKVWEEEPPRIRHDRRISIRFNDGTGARNNGLVVFGRLRAPDGFNDCRSGERVNVQRRVNGRWVTKKTTNTNRRGRYAVEIFDLASRYRAVAPRTEILDDDGSNRVDVCRKAIKAKRHRHRR